MKKLTLPVYGILGIFLLFALLTTISCTNQKAITAARQAPHLSGDQKAITDTGQEVFLKSDGTWSFTKTPQKVQAIGTNKQRYKTPKASTFLLKSTTNKSAFWINTDKWTFEKGKEANSKEYLYKLKNGKLLGMSITEGFEVPLETLSEIAYENALSFSPDVVITQKEYRNVNDKKVIFLRLDASHRNIPFTFFAYHYASPSGCTQHIVYTSTKLVAEYETEIFDFLNGLTIQ